VFDLQRPGLWDFDVIRQILYTAFNLKIHNIRPKCIILFYTCHWPY